MLKNWAPPSVVVLLALFVLATGNSPAVHGGANGRAYPRAVVAVQPTAASFSHLPIVFEPNMGQTDPRVKYLARGGGYTLFLTSDEAVFVAQSANRRSVLRMRLRGANRKAVIRGVEQLPGRSNYFIGSEPSKRPTDVPHYAGVEYREVYSGVDLAFYSRHGKLEYDWVVKPGGDPAAIRVAFEGAEHMRIDAGGDLVLATGSGEFLHRRPVVYQELHGDRRELQGRYELTRKREVRFRVDSYDRAAKLVIDPSLVFSALLGGDATARVFDASLATAVALDPVGNVYVVGMTASPDFPVRNAVLPVYPASLCGPPMGPPGGCVGLVFVAKLSAAGDALLYSTFLGFASGTAIAVDASGSAYVTGAASDTTWPVAGPAFPSAPTVRCGYPDSDWGNVRPSPYVAKLSPSGSALDYVTCLSNITGGGEVTAYAIAVDSGGNAHVAGGATAGYSMAGVMTGKFPTTPGAFQASYSGPGDAFVLKFGPDGSLIYSTLIGGSSYDSARGIAIDAAGNSYITGSTSSSDFPTTPGSFPGRPGVVGLFIVKLSADGTRLIASSTPSAGPPAGVALDPAGNVYVTGAGGLGFRVTSGIQPLSGGAGDAYVAKFTPDLCCLVYATHLGGKGEDRGTAIVADAAGNAYVAGSTYSPDFPMVKPLQAALNGGCCPSPPGHVPGFPPSDAFIAKLNPAGTALLYSTYLGGKDNDVAYGIAADGQGNAVVVGGWDSGSFPAVGPVQLIKDFETGAFIAKISEAGSLPLFSAQSTTNGASFTASVSPGAITTIFGTGITSVSGIVTAASLPLPTELAGTSVLVNDQPAPLFAVANVNGQEQINFQAPVGGIPARGLTVVNRGVKSIPVGFNLFFLADPGIFTTDGTHAAAQHGSDFRPITLSDPAQKGEAVVIYATGLGDMKPEPGWGKPASASPLSLTVAKTSATISGIPAEVLFSGLAPGFVGLGQINLRIPQSVPSGDLDLVIQVDTPSPATSKKVKLPIR
jgi:uncharacterized protein (TIGR03437 family)